MAAILPLCSSVCVVREMLKQVCNLVVNGYELLPLACRFEATHDLLPNPRWLMRILGPVVQSLVLSMFKAQAHIIVRRGIALELVDDQNPRYQTDPRRATANVFFH